MNLKLATNSARRQAVCWTTASGQVDLWWKEELSRLRLEHVAVVACLSYGIRVSRRSLDPAPDTRIGSSCPLERGRMTLSFRTAGSYADGTTKRRLF